MKFQIDGHGVEVRFWHGEDDDGCLMTSVDVFSDLLPDGQLFGTAYCHPNDQFSRKTGRKLALDRALYVLGDNEERLVPRSFTVPFWKEYFKSVPADKKNKKLRKIQLKDGTWVNVSDLEKAWAVYNMPPTSNN